MKFVGFPNGLGITTEKLQRWLKHIESKRPMTNHYSIYEDIFGYCGETFYSIDEFGYASLDIKLLPMARGKGLASIALSYSIEQAFKHGAVKVWVDPNPNNTKAILPYMKDLDLKEIICQSISLIKKIPIILILFPFIWIFLNEKDIFEWLLFNLNRILKLYFYSNF